MKELRKIIHIENEDYDPCLYPIPQDLKQDLTICYKERDIPALLEQVIISSPDVHSTHIRSPYDDNIYYRIEDFEIESWRAKIRHISAVARRLGATAVSFKGEIHSKSERIIDFSAGGEWALSPAHADWSTKDEDTLQLIVEEKQEFDPDATIPTIAEYDKTVQYAKEHHIYGNAEVLSMLEARNPRESNMLGKREVNISLCNETNSNLKLAIKLGVPAYGLKVDADFQEAVRFEKKIYIKVEYIFSQKRKS